jgi:hypothetical protein
LGSGQHLDRGCGCRIEEFEVADLLERRALAGRRSLDDDGELGVRLFEGDDNVHAVTRLDDRPDAGDREAHRRR